MKGNLVIGQSGGPTSVINCSLAGVVEESMKHKQIGKIYGMQFGVEGLIEENIIDLRKEPKSIWKALMKRPGSALGSCRHKIKEENFEPIKKVLMKYNIRYLFLIGGNDTMDTINRVTEYCSNSGYEMIGIGIPKTVDNDLYGTDHCPGYPSAARYVAISTRHGGILAKDMRRVDPVLAFQTVGRNSGWLAASSALCRENDGDYPHLIYVPEKPLNLNRFYEDVENCYRKHGWVHIVCGEGIVYEDGRPVSVPDGGIKDKFNNIEFGSTGGSSAAMVLHRLATTHLKLRGEFQIPESLQMCSADRVSEIDRQEAYMVGKEGVKLAVSGKNKVMVTIVRKSNKPYRSVTGTIPLTEPSKHTKPMPKDFFNERGNDVTEEFLEYLRPLAGKIPDYGDLEAKK